MCGSYESIAPRKATEFILVRYVSKNIHSMFLGVSLCLEYSGTVMNEKV
jgi:hypothetical protein